MPRCRMTRTAYSGAGLLWDVTVSGGDLAGFTGTVGLNLSGTQNITDLAGNALPTTEPTTDDTYTVDNTPPTATIVVADTSLIIGETSLVTITFSEAVTGFANADLTIANGTLSAVSSSDGGTTWTATFTPTSNITDATNVITLNNTGVSDAAGNAGSGTTDSNNYAIDTAPPTANLRLIRSTVCRCSRESKRFMC